MAEQEERARSAATAPSGSPGCRRCAPAPSTASDDEPDHHHRPEQLADAARCRGAGTGTAPSARPASPARPSCAGPGAATSRPSTADSTEIAGVMTPSPKKIAVPKMPRTAAGAGAASAGRFTACEASASIAIRPPSPLLSARRISDHVLERDDDRQRPEHQRQHAVDVVARVSGTWPLREHLLQRVQRAGADVAVDDAEGAERQRGKAGGGAVGGSRGVARLRSASGSGAAIEGRLLCLAARSRAACRAGRARTLLVDLGVRGRWPRARSSPPPSPGGRSRRTCRSGSARWRRAWRRAWAAGWSRRRPAARSSRPGEFRFSSMPRSALTR